MVKIILKMTIEWCTIPPGIWRLNPGGGGDYAYEKDEDARRKFWTKPLKQTDPVVAQAFFDP